MKGEKEERRGNKDMKGNIAFRAYKELDHIEKAALLISDFSILFPFKENGPPNEKGKSNKKEVNPRIREMFVREQ